VEDESGIGIGGTPFRVVQTGKIAQALSASLRTVQSQAGACGKEQHCPKTYGRPTRRVRGARRDSHRFLYAAFSVIPRRCRSSQAMHLTRVRDQSIGLKKVVEKKVVTLHRQRLKSRGRSSPVYCSEGVEAAGKKCPRTGPAREWLRPLTAFISAATAEFRRRSTRGAEGLPEPSRDASP
jgi:hypothetical protein